MTTFLARRLALVLPTLFFVSLLIFGLQQLLPGGHFSSMGILLVLTAAPPLVLLVRTGRTWCVRLMRGPRVAP